MSAPLSLPAATLPLRLRPLQLDDIPTVLAIEATAVPTPWTAEGYTHELTRNTLAHYRALDLQPQPDAPLTLIGYGGYWLIADEVHISILAIHPAWRGRGLGEWLLLDLLRAAWAWRPLLATLEVRENNRVAQSLYTKLGFILSGRRRRYYKDTGEDALLMTVEPFDAIYDQHLAQLQGACAQRLARVLVQNNLLDSSESG